MLIKSSKLKKEKDKKENLKKRTDNDQRLPG